MNIESIIIYLLQTLFFFYSITELIKLTRIFSNVNSLKVDTLDSDGKTGYDLIIIEGKSSKIFKHILDKTNEYLKKNIGTSADYNILKEISERYYLNQEKKITTLISFPIYLGLIGTILGIIIGLNGFNIDSLTNSTSISILFAGVKSAMIASFLGLFFSIILNFLFIQCKRIVDSKRNQYYDFLQRDLLPELSKDMNDSLNKIKVVLESFNEDFNNKFSENLKDFNKGSKDIFTNIELQKELVSKLTSARFEKVVESNIKIINKLEASDDLFTKINNFSISINSLLSNTLTYITDFNKSLTSYANFENEVRLILTDIKNSIEINKNSVAYIRNKFEDENIINSKFISYADDFKTNIQTIFSQVNLTLADLQKNVSNEINRSEKNNEINIKKLDEVYSKFESSLINLNEKLILFISEYKKENILAIERNMESVVKNHDSIAEKTTNFLKANENGTIIKEMNQSLKEFNINMQQQMSGVNNAIVNTNDDLKKISTNEIIKKLEITNNSISAINENVKDLKKQKGFFARHFGRKANG